MRSLGIIRRIDDLGRIAIPKELRNNLRIKEGTAFEIFVGEENGEIILKKYQSGTDWELVGKVIRGLDPGLLLILEQGTPIWVNPGLFGDELETLTAKHEEIVGTSIYEIDSRKVMIKKFEINGYEYVIATTTMTAMNNNVTTLKNFLEA